MTPNYTDYTCPTALLNHNDPKIQRLIDKFGWRHRPPTEAACEIYYFVRDEIAFGYNRDDDISAAEVLKDGFGQCNTKSTLFMALLRALGIPCRFHGFTIDNELQRGAIPNYLMPLAPKRILHSWVEVFLDGNWINTEGFIVDRAFLTQIQRAYPKHQRFSGFGIAVACLQSPPNEFNVSHTYIQSEGINDDFGVFASPDKFYHIYGTNLKGLKKFGYRYIFRHLINRHVRKIRQNGIGKRHALEQDFRY